MGDRHVLVANLVALPPKPPGDPPPEPMGDPDPDVIGDPPDPDDDPEEPEPIGDPDENGGPARAMGALDRAPNHC